MHKLDGGKGSISGVGYSSEITFSNSMPTFFHLHITEDKAICHISRTFGIKILV